MNTEQAFRENERQWTDAATNPQATLVVVTKADIAGRYEKGEIGVLLENDFPSKYDIKILLYPDPPTNLPDDLPDFLVSVITAPRVYFGWYDEVEYLFGPGIEYLKPGAEAAPVHPARAEAEAMAEIIFHDAKVDPFAEQ